MRILNFNFVEKWCSDKIRELDWGIAHIKQWEPTYPDLIYKSNYNMLKSTLVTVLVVSVAATHAQQFSVVNATINDTHAITTTQHGEELLTTIVTNNYTTYINHEVNGKFLGQTNKYYDGRKEVIAPYGAGKATKYTKKGSHDIKVTYADEKGSVYRTETLHANNTFSVDFLNGTTSSIDDEGTIIETDSNKTQTTYSNGTKVTTTKTAPITTIITHPDGSKTTKFEKNGTIIEEDKHGGKILNRGNITKISYNDSQLNIGQNQWELELAGDDDHHQEL
ncbi:hypothetical protein [Candidatus Tisiphia endosymbiont of Nemotelus uliginosus]|uniref:hypothetical protein n=1 Tax=Candidatus Tisiphia endosymbiont of Nemotelus uliginosus TaxID=3077926 RepID=UPI0035C915C8